MRQRLYIQSAAAISPQRSFEREAFLQPALSSDDGKLFAIDTDYSRYISPVAIRRMSRLLKMSISTAMQCLKDADLKTPDAIVTGTGRGGVTDMEQFVKDLSRLNEEAMNPTAFIQSTYNSPNGWIATQSACTAYNQTYVHRGCSFELALQDAQMLVAESDKPLRILVGCYDELTDEYHIIRGRRDYWKKEQLNSLDLQEHGNTPGTIAGEGAAFFVLGTERGAARACIVDIQIIHDATSLAIGDGVNAMLLAAGLSPDDISLVLSGMNGDSRQSHLYLDTIQNLPEDLPVVPYKQLCGEYDTASGFGLWLAESIISKPEILPLIVPGERLAAEPKHILFVNHYILGAATLMLIAPSAERR